jgi:cytochrome c peroxidase
MKFSASLVFTSLIAAASALRNPKCKVWKDMRADLDTLFHNPSNDSTAGNNCGPPVHFSLRLSFHDTFGYNPTLERLRKYPGGGADGSVFYFKDIEMNYTANNFFEPIYGMLTPIADKYNVTYGDMIQFAATYGVLQCPGAPRMTFQAGRKKAIAAAADRLVPVEEDSVEFITKRFAEVGLTPREMVALTGGAHSVGRFASKKPIFDFDRTYTIFDTQFFLDVLLASPVNLTNTTTGSFTTRLKSDLGMAHHPLTACHMHSFINDQQALQETFAPAFAKMAVIGVNKRDLYDCTEVLPDPIPLGKNPVAYFPPCAGPADVDFSGCPSSAKKVKLPEITEKCPEKQ